MKKILLSAFSCDPSKGSEPSHGWNWAVGLASEGFDVHCFTRISGKEVIEKSYKPDTLTFHYVTLPFNGEQLYNMSTLGMYIYYLLWQWYAYKAAKVVHKYSSFSLAHHVSWGSTQMGSFMYKLNIPFIFGPAGGGQNAPSEFKSYFLRHWNAEEKREKLSRWMLKYNPACRGMLNKAKVVLVCNPETEQMVRSVGAKKVEALMDSALPKSFFPEQNKTRQASENKLKLLWIGRFLPRKGLLLVLDVMKELKQYNGITLTVVGDGEMKKAFLNKIEINGLENSVQWAGKVAHEKVKDFYNSHDVFFFTSLRDSCPAQLIEAMAYGMPVVTLNLHGQAIIVNDKTGILCECTSPEITIKELKSAILKFYNNPGLVSEKSENAYEYALAQTWDRKIKYVIEKYYNN